MTEKLLVNITIPLYNEEKILENSVRTLMKFLKGNIFPYPFEVILANNASTDHSLDICSKLSKEYSEIKVLNLSTKGKGIAVRTSWTESSASVLSFMDADMASDISFFQALVEGVALKDYDMVIGNRLGKNSVILNRQPFRGIMSKFYNFLVRLFLNTGIVDHQCGFKAMKKDSFLAISPNLEENGFFFDTEMIALTRKKGFRILPIDIRWTDQKDSKVSFFKDSLLMFLGIFRLRQRIR